MSEKERERERAVAHSILSAAQRDRWNTFPGAPLAAPLEPISLLSAADIQRSFGTPEEELNSARCAVAT